MGNEIIIVGAGGHGRVCAEIADAAGFTVYGFADDNHELGDDINGVLCIANTFDDLQEHCKPGFRMLFIAINDNLLRQEIYRKGKVVGFEIPTLVHPSAIISPSATLGSGCVIMPGAIVNANASIGLCSILNTGCYIDYDVVLEDGVQVSPGVSIAGGARIGAHSFIGTGASIIPGVSVGEGCLIGAGAAVTKDVADGQRVAGVPARPIQ